MKTIKITAVKQVVHNDLISAYENPINHACDIKIGDTYFSFDGKKPINLCESAWESMEKFVVGANEEDAHLIEVPDLD